MNRLLLSIAALAVASGPALAQPVGLGASPPGSFHHTTATVIAGVISEATSIDPRVQNFAAPQVYLPAIGSGELEFGFANVIEAMLAYEGDEHYGGRALPDLRVVTVTSPLRAGFFVRQDSPMQELSDLAGQRVPGEFSQQQIVNVLIGALFAAAGLEQDDVVTVPVPNVSRNTEEFVTGRADTMYFALGAGRVTEVDASVGGIRLLPLHDTPEVRAALSSRVPQAYVYLQQPEQGLTGVTEPIGVLAWDAVMLVHAGVSDDVVYAITQAMHDAADRIAGAAGTVSLFNRGAMARDLAPLQYHPGAIRFYEEAGLWPPQGN